MPTLLTSENIDAMEDLGLSLQCPTCRSELRTMKCVACGFCIRVINGIWDALPPGRARYFTPFAKDYEKIRSAEGRGCDNSAFYLALPYRDHTGKNSSQWRIRGRSYDFLLSRILAPNLPSRAQIVDLGAGNGWMSYRLASADYRPVAVDLITNAQDGLGAAEHYRSGLGGLFPRFRAEIEHLPFSDRLFHAAIFNASFHYSENYEATLREALRCVAPGGLVVICDTPWYPDDRSGRQMLSERSASFRQMYGTPSDSLHSEEYLTPSRLLELEQNLQIHITTYSPYYGVRWAMRPFLAWIRRRRRPSHFRIYVIRKST